MRVPPRSSRSSCPRLRSMRRAGARRCRRSRAAARVPCCGSSSREAARECDTGAISGHVLKGAFAGRELESRAPIEMAQLWLDCRFADPQSAQILEAYLDRVHPTWRDDLSRAEGGDGPAPAGKMTK